MLGYLPVIFLRQILQSFVSESVSPVRLNSEEMKFHWSPVPKTFYAESNASSTNFCGRLTC